MERKKFIKKIEGKDIPCKVSVLKDYVEKDDFFSIFFNAKIYIKKVSGKDIVVEIMHKQQKIEKYYLETFLDAIDNEKGLDVVLNDKFQIISIKTEI